MGFLDIFRPLRQRSVQKWKELGTYNAYFSVFGNDAFRSATVRACIRPLAEFTSKAAAKCSDSRIERILDERPNMYMSGRDFLYKIRVITELTNNCFIYIERDDRGKAVGFYPVPCSWFEAVEYNNGLFIRFYFSGSTRELTLPWEDLAVMRKDYNKSDIAGDQNDAILATLQSLATAEEGLNNAIKSTANLRGILKSTKGMLAPDAVKAQKDAFVKDYLSLENEGGIAALDSTQEFTPIKMEPLTATYEQTKEIRENIYRYFGVNDDIIMSRMTPDQIESFYELRVEPFLVALSKELTAKVYPGKAGAYNNYIIFEANKLTFASLSQKISMYKEVVLNGGMTPDEWRAACNMAPLPDGLGQKPLLRLDVGKAEDTVAGGDTDAD